MKKEVWETLPFHERQEGGFKNIWNLKLVSFLTQEEYTLVDQLANNQSHDLAKVSSRDQFLPMLSPLIHCTEKNSYFERLFPGFVGSVVHNCIKLRPRKMFMLERIECTLFVDSFKSGNISGATVTYPFAVDSHLSRRIDA